MNPFHPAPAISHAATSDSYNRSVFSFQKGQRVRYAGSDNQMVLKNFKKSETDDSNQLKNQYISSNKHSIVTVVNKKTAPWHVDYYQIKFGNGSTGLVMSSDVFPVNFMKTNGTAQSNTNYQKAAQNAFNYINQIRREHNLKQFQWSNALADIAAKRNQQLPKYFSHYNRDGSIASNKLLSSLHYYDQFLFVDENVDKTYS